MSTNKLNRRAFVKVAGISIASMPLISKAQTELERLAEDDPTAVALGYKEVGTEVDAEKYPNHTPEQICSGCVLYTGDDLGWGGCGVFPGKQVAGGGWCSAWVAKPA